MPSEGFFCVSRNKQSSSRKVTYPNKISVHPLKSEFVCGGHRDLDLCVQPELCTVTVSHTAQNPLTCWDTQVLPCLVLSVLEPRCFKVGPELMTCWFILFLECSIFSICIVKCNFF